MKINKKNILALTISIIFIIVIFHNIDFKKLLETFKLFDYKVIFLFIPLYAFTYYLRGIRWKILLHDESKFPVLDLSGICVLGSTLNSYLPARVGDFFRAYHLGKKYNSSKIEIFASIVLERIFDCIATLSLLFVAISLYHKTKWGLNASILTGLALIASIAGFYFAHKYNKTDKICANLKNFSSKFSEKIATTFCTLIDKINSVLNSFIGGLKALTNFKNTIFIILLSALIWLMECFIIYVLIRSFGYDVSFSISLFAISFVAFASIIPSSSILIGPTQYAFILALGIYHIGKSQALAISFTQQILMLLIITTISLIVVIKDNLTYKKLNEEIKEVEDFQDS